jgi:hypothetical protein
LSGISPYTESSTLLDDDSTTSDNSLNKKPRAINKTITETSPTEIDNLNDFNNNEDNNGYNNIDKSSGRNLENSNNNSVTNIVDINNINENDITNNSNSNNENNNDNIVNGNNDNTIITGINNNEHNNNNIIINNNVNNNNTINHDDVNNNVAVTLRDDVELEEARKKRLHRRHNFGYSIIQKIRIIEEAKRVEWVRYAYHNISEESSNRTFKYIGYWTGGDDNLPPEEANVEDQLENIIGYDDDTVISRDILLLPRPRLWREENNIPEPVDGEYSGLIDLKVNTIGKEDEDEGDTDDEVEENLYLLENDGYGYESGS